MPFSVQDIYQHNPWRAPGNAPVNDACGIAGGSPSRQNGAEAGDYVKTTYAQHGDFGTKTLMQPIPGLKAPIYKRGGTAVVSWTIRNNHGGGYSYRLCPTPSNFSDLTEACFQVRMRVLVLVLVVLVVVLLLLVLLLPLMPVPLPLLRLLCWRACCCF